MVGKTESIKNYCFKEAQKGNVTIYYDLKTLNGRSNADISEFISEKLINIGKSNSSIKRNIDNLGDSKALSTNIINFLKDKEITLVFDHYNHETHSEFIFNNLSFYNENNLKLIVCSNNNEILKSSIKRNIF